MGAQRQDRWQAASAESAERAVLRFAGHDFVPLPSGALFWPAQDTLLVADLHFEKMASFARFGHLLPPYDTGLTLGWLEADLLRCGARRLIALGDNFHAPDAAAHLSAADRRRLDALTARIECVWLLGNHDPAPLAIGGTCRHDVQIAGLTFTHEPRLGREKGGENGGMIAGHLHPAARVAVNGRSTRRPCFVHDQRLLILPAYGSATGAINILSPAFAGLFDPARLAVIMLGRERTYPVSTRRLIPG